MQPDGEGSLVYSIGRNKDSCNSGPRESGLGGSGLGIRGSGTRGSGLAWLAGPPSWPILGSQGRQHA